MTLFGREPALLLSMVYAAIALFGGHVLHLDGTKQGVLNMVAAAVLGVIMAATAAKDKLAASLFALAKVVVAGVAAFGLSLSGPTQADIMTFVGFVLMYFTRQSITAPISVEGQKVLSA